MSENHVVAENIAYETQSAHSAEAAPESGASVDKIRDIIFGSQIKNYEARFARLEESLARETFELKDSMRKRLESIESFFKTESEALAARLRSEKEDRATSISNVERETKDAHISLSKRLGDIDAALNDGHSSLRKELMTESRKLLEEIDQRYDSLRSLMESRVSELRTNKVDRAFMSDLLREMAAHLDNDQASTPE
jgi:hypothetical protein